MLIVEKRGRDSEYHYCVIDFKEKKREEGRGGEKERKIHVYERNIKMNIYS